MSSARDSIFGKLRTALQTKNEAERETRVAERLAAHAPNLIPAIAQLEGEARIERFIQENEALSTSVERLASLDLVPEAIARFLAQQNLPARLKAAPDERLIALPWERAQQLEVAFGAASPDDLVGFAHAFAAAAESGTLLLTSGATGPVALNFLPDLHIVLLRETDLLGSYEDTLAKLRAEYGAALPRALNFITGPSRTADIEQTIVLGAHGPRRLHIFLVA